MKKVLIFTLLITFHGLTTEAQNSQQSGKDKTEIQKAQQLLLDAKQQHDQAAAEYQKAAVALDQAKRENELARLDRDGQGQLIDRFFTVAGIIAASISLALVLLGMSIKKAKRDGMVALNDVKNNMIRKLETDINVEVAKYAQERKAVIEAIVDGRLYRNDLRESKIQIINNSNTTDSKGFNEALKGFKNKTVKSVDGIEKAHSLTFNDIGLVVFENMDTNGFWALEQTETKAAFNQLLQKVCSEEIPFVYYGAYLPKEFIKPEFDHLVTFANTPAQLYGNIMNMLKYRHFAKQD